ncbi:AP-3 complex subunit beta [Cryptococcus gattii E566]|uniref:Golgi to vacuole transport-related protein, putative n=1 Tax=Cryptococcus gattii serotype B (strain WM276 / ATCC MYA-4071) TaxID=367775 RepID=E6R2R1_CRYGW|nr:Golgi to vacuole transport-related protein, putative [Cryptococcus gattii WM276]ADV20791.1 Golgi to vacuole transport-related protein, putative [Cryptococcus gattii WM276]KIY33291.1 AP-3 complex subunit beta [Cryptococcus gattii E566]KJE03617.1 AP-3 complex subunit beta [Cryptococcus gattii NT-10]
MAALNRLSQRIMENFQETTRDLSLIAGSGSSTTYFDTSDERLKEISKLLESRSERERLEGMKRIIAGMSKGRDMEPFFAQVVKNVVSQSIEIRKLVYIYLLRFASTNSDLVLLSINTFQKDLSDPSPLIRSMSLRVLTSIRVPVIQGIVMLGLKKLVNDRNPWVRKTVAGGLAKVYEMDNSSLLSLISLLQTLLSSPSPLTLGASLTAFQEMCPERLDLLHPYFRHICRLIVDADEWGQAVALEVLVRYARAMLEKPIGVGAVRPQPKTEHQKHGDQSEDEFEGIDQDLAMLLYCIKPLFHSRNPAVILATAKAYWCLAPVDHAIVGQHLLVKPLLRLAGSSSNEENKGKEIVALTWEIVAEMVDERPWLFTPYQSSFILHSQDSSLVQKAKLRALGSMHYIRLPDVTVAEEAVRAIGSCIKTHSDLASSGLSALMKLLKSDRETLVAQAVLVLKSIILSHSQAFGSSTSSPQLLVARLAKGLDTIVSPKARASVYWLVGQFSAIDPSEESEKKGLGWEGVALWVPDVLRKAIKGFTNESLSAKLQILTLATKILVITQSNPKLELLAQYLFMLARYDADYDVRDRARFLSALLRGVREEKPVNGNSANSPLVEEKHEQDTGGVVLRREQVKLAVLGRSQPKDVEVVKGGKSREFEIASTSRIAGKKLKGYEALPDWTDDPTDSSLRDSDLDKPRATTPAPTGISSQTLIRPHAPLHISSASSVPKRAFQNTSSVASVSPASSSPAGSASHTVINKSKLQDLDAFLNSETESETERETETESESEEDNKDTRLRDVSYGVGNAAAEYEYDEETDESEDETDSEASEGEEQRLYRG